MQRLPSNVTTVKLTGVLLEHSAALFWLLADDGRTIQTPTVAGIQYRRQDFNVGDVVRVDTARTPAGLHLATAIRVVRKADEASQSAASDALLNGVGQGFRHSTQYSPISADPVLNAAWAATLAYARELPNFMVQQRTVRRVRVTEKNPGRVQDEITAELVTEKGRETFRNVLVNGLKPATPPDRTGAWSTGEFVGDLMLVMDPGSGATFQPLGEDTLERPAWKYSFAVDQKHSRWWLSISGQHFAPAISGALWIDQKSSRVVKLQLSTGPVPEGFTLTSAGSMVECGFVMLGNQEYPLPLRAATVSCTRGEPGCRRNEIEFRDYRKFGAESAISFDRQ